MEKFELLKAMNTLVKLMNDEGAYMEWIYIIPDQADDEELMDIALNYPDIVKDAVDCFKDLYKRYAKSGFYVDKKLY
jgi:hypothetical protein